MELLLLLNEHIYYDSHFITNVLIMSIQYRLCFSFIRSANFHFIFFFIGIKCRNEGKYACIYQNPMFLSLGHAYFRFALNAINRYRQWYCVTPLAYSYRREEREMNRIRFMKNLFGSHFYHVYCYDCAITAIKQYSSYIVRSGALLNLMRSFATR